MFYSYFYSAAPDMKNQASSGCVTRTPKGSTSIATMTSGNILSRLLPTEKGSRILGKMTRENEVAAKYASSA